MIVNYAEMVGKTFAISSPKQREWMPFSATGIKVNIKVLGDYKTYIVAQVLPHKNPKGFLISSPYNITIDKVDIENQRILFD